MCGTRRVLFTSACCGATFSPGAGPDDIVDLRSELSALAPDESLTVTTAPQPDGMKPHFHRDLTAEDAGDEWTPEAYRDGPCPACGAERPLLALASAPTGDCAGCGPTERSPVGGGLGDLVLGALAYLAELALWFLAGAGIAALVDAFAEDALRALSRLAGATAP